MKVSQLSNAASGRWDALHENQSVLVSIHLYQTSNET
jgi:hypothetical protein